MKIYDVENKYQNYLKRVNLDESTMGEEQKKQLRQTWYAAYAQMIVDLDEITSLTENEAVAALDSMNAQVTAYWLLIKYA